MPDKITNVKIVKNKKAFQLLVNGKPYLIKGAVGNDYLFVLFSPSLTGIPLQLKIWKDF